MASTKILRKLFVLFLSAIMVLSLSACAGNAESAPSDSDNSTPASEQPSSGGSEAAGDNASEKTEGGTLSDNKILVAYFSHTGENYNVGVIEKGNTHIVADTACHYCVSHCSQGLDIPTLLAFYNEHSFTKGGFIAPMALSSYPNNKLPSACLGCRSCEAVCPQRIKISEAMADFAEKLNM